MRCVLVVGHKPSSPGAKNKKADLTEYTFNDGLALSILTAMSNIDIEVGITYRNTYKNLPDEINNLNPDLVISLHCNAYNTKASGSETLFYHKSSTSLGIAGLINNNISKALGLKNRGIKAKTSEDRGGYLLRNTKAPCVIVEPFFIDNDNDLELVLGKRESLVNAFVESIVEIKETLK